MSVSVRMQMHKSEYTLAALDDDTREVVVSFLAARDVLALQACSTGWNAACRARELWSRLVAADFEIARPPSLDRGSSVRNFVADSASRIRSLFPQRSTSVLNGPITEHPYAVYRRYTLARRQRRAVEKERAQARLALAESVTKKTRLRYCLDVLEYPLGLGAYGVGTFITVLLVLLKLNGTAPDLPWAGALAPPVLLAAIFTFSICVGACTSFCSARCPSHSMCSDQREASEDSSFEFLSRFTGVGAERIPRRKRCLRGFSRCASWTWVCGLAGLLLVALPVLIALKLHGWAMLDGVSWAVTLSPLWVAFGWWCFFPLILRSGDACAAFAVSLILYVPLVIVAAIAVARIDGVHYTPVAAMLAPFWLLDLVVVCTLLVFCVMACRDDDDRTAMCLASWTGFAIFGTLIIAQVWASIADAEGLPFPANGVLGPIAAFIGIAALANCACALAMFIHSRRHNYEDAYSRRTCARVCCGGCCCFHRHAEHTPVIVVINTFGTAAAMAPMRDVGL